MCIHRAAGILIVSLATIVAGCEDSGPRHAIGIGTGSFVGASPVVAASLFPQTIGFAAVANFRCPSIAPFVTTFSLFLDQRSGSDIFVDQVRFRFVDHSGLASPLLLSRSDLSALFGSTLVVAGATRVFDFRPQFGCGLGSVPSNLFVDFITLNRSGVASQSTLTAALR